jgi:hypothetical protein
MSALSCFHMGMVARLQCVVCRRFGLTGQAVELHHVAEGSGKRNDFAVVPLCHEHHTGAAGFHGMGERAFCALYRPPGDRESGMLVWMIEDLARFLRKSLP